MNLEEVGVLKQRAAKNQKPGCRILGFKNMKTLNSCFNIDKSYFLYPSDEEVEGSKSAFVALYKSMLKRNVYAIGEFLLKVTANSPRLVALVPQAEVRVDKATDEVSERAFWKTRMRCEPHQLHYIHFAHSLPYANKNAPH